MRSELGGFTRINTRSRLFGRFCILLLLVAGCGERSIIERLPPPDQVSWQTVLQDTLDLRNLSRRVEPWERSMLWSSALGAGNTSLTSLALQLHGDMDHGNFLRVEDRGSYVEATLMEVDGSAGMITWMQSANPTGTIKLYVDDKEHPS